MKVSCLLALLFILSLHYEGHSQECVNGLMSAERVRQLGRVAGDLTKDRNRQQRIVPDINFTCNGTITKWIVAGELRVNEKYLPELQIWRETDDAGVYTKIHHTTLNITAASSTEIYEYNTTDLVDVQSGDVLGMFEPDHSILRLYYTDTYGPVNYYKHTPSGEATAPNGNFDIQSDGVEIINDTALVRVEFTPTVDSLSSDCISSFATMEMIKIGRNQSGGDRPIKEEEKQQRLIPGINFICHGFISKWILAAKWESGNDRINLPELQTWSSTDGTTYTKQGAITFNVTGGSEEMSYYEYSPSPPPEFNHGNVFGMFIPDKTRFKLFFVRVDSAPVNYFTGTGGDQSPREGNYTTTGQDTVNAVPLVAVSVNITSLTVVPSSPPITAKTSGAGKIASVYPTVSSYSATSLESRESSEAATGVSTAVATVATISVTATHVASPISVSMTHLASPTSVLTTHIASSPPGKDDDNSSSSYSSGAIAGIVVVVVILVLVMSLVVVAVGMLVAQRKRKESYSAQGTEMNTVEGMANPVYDGRDFPCNHPQPLGGTELNPMRNSMNPIYASANQHVYEDVEPLHYEEFVACTTKQTNPDRQLRSYYVPTVDQRELYGASEAVYAVLESTVGSRDEAEVYFQESEIYWAPASSKSDLYAQLSENRFREIPSPHIMVTDLLGAGQFGQVSRGVWQTPSGSTDVAVKMLRPSASEVDKVKFLQEAANMGQFHHPNVVTLHGVVTVVEPAMIILELMKFGDLRSYLQSMQPIPGELVPSNTPRTCLDFCCQIASGMDYLSKKAFVHRDLAARNILVSEQKKCKIADFGMSRDLRDGDYYVSQGGKIPIRWTAPEAINYKKYSTASDVWSYGAVMYEIWSLGHKPFEGYNNMQVILLVNKGTRLPPPSGCPKAVYQLMIDCWHPEAGSRPSFSDLLQSLSRPETELLSWTEEDTKTHPQAVVLGGPLDAGKNLYPDLQGAYTSG